MIKKFAIQSLYHLFGDSVHSKEGTILPLGVFYIVVDMMESGLNDFWLSIAVINVAVTIVTVVYAQSKLRKFCK